MRYGLLGLVMLLGFGAATGCEAPVAEDEGFSTSCEGAALDGGGTCRAPNGRFARKACCEMPTGEALYTCNVVDLKTSISKPGLGNTVASRLDVDDNGAARHDVKSTQVIVTETGIQLGTTQLNGAAAIERDEIDVSEWLEQGVVEYRATQGDDAYRVRIFEESKAGILLVETENGQRAFATLDCRPSVAKLPAPVLDPNDLGCDIAWFDYDLRDYDGQMGAPMSLDYFDVSYGASDIDESYIGAGFERTNSGLEASLGGFGFSEEDGDVITFKESGDVISWTLAPEGWERFEVRLSKTTGLGVVTVEAADGEAAGRLAIIDCSDTGYPDVYSF